MGAGFVAGAFEEAFTSGLAFAKGAVFRVGAAFEVVVTLVATGFFTGAGLDAALAVPAFAGEAFALGAILAGFPPALTVFPADLLEAGAAWRFDVDFEEALGGTDGIEADPLVEGMEEGAFRVEAELSLFEVFLEGLAEALCGFLDGIP